MLYYPIGNKVRPSERRKGYATEINNIFKIKEM